LPREKPLLDDWSAGWGIVSFERSAAVGFDINFDINCAGRPRMLLDERQPKSLEIEYARGCGAAKGNPSSGRTRVLHHA